MALSSSRIFFELDAAAALPLVSLQCFFLAGSSADPPGRAGLANLTAEMLKRGTSTLSRRRFLERLELLGGAIDVFCSKDFCLVRGEVLRRRLAPFLDLFLEMLTAPRFDQEEMAGLRHELISQMALDREDDAHLLHLAFWPAFFGTDHPYGHQVEGDAASLPRITGEEIRSFFSSRYGTNHLYLAISGQLRQGELEKQILRRFEQLPAGGAAGPAPRQPHRLPIGCEGRLILRPGRTQNQVLLACPGITAAAPENIALQLALTGFGGTFRSRLTREIRDRRGLSYHASANLPELRQAAPLYLHTFFEKEKTTKGLPLLCALLDGFLRHGLSFEELEHARRYLQNSLPFAEESPEKKLALAISHRLLGRPNGYWEDYRRGLNTLDRLQVNRSLQQLDGQRRLLIVVGDKQILSQKRIASLASSWQTVESQNL